jgi:3-methylcrotonyl-CoA carboxylase alpha subunit
MKTFDKILVANRGEIAVRIIKSARKLGIRTATIYANDDTDSLHVSYADEAYLLGGNTLADTYLNIEKIVNIAQKTGCQAIHPGYGFLAENPAFVKACKSAGLVFIGPDEDVMHLMGNKVEARKFAIKNNIPVIQGITGTIGELSQKAENIGFPVLIKAAAGGGGKGMTVVYNKADLLQALEATARQAKSYFGDDTIFVEKYIEQPRHIEVQVIADGFGNVVHLFERECSVQRRHQKIIEEAPSPTLNEEVREKMLETAIVLTSKIGYKNAGTIEFLVDKNLNFYFLEMNTRVQVEHPVTEFITGVDIVAEQISIAAGNPLSFSQNDIKINGNAIECRIYAEDPENNYAPAPGKLTFYKHFETSEIRVDTGILPNSEIKSSYDPMIAKLIVHSDNRISAIDKMIFALNNFVVQGIKNNISFLKELVDSQYFRENKISVKFCDEKTQHIIDNIIQSKENIEIFVPLVAFALYSIRNKQQNSIWEKIGFWRNSGTFAKFEINNDIFEVEFLKIKDTAYSIKINEETFDVCGRFDADNELRCKINGNYYQASCSEDEKGNGYVTIDAYTFHIKRKDVLPKEMSVSELLESAGVVSNEVKPPMPGRIVKIEVEQGQEVEKGQVLLILESMKMENQILAQKKGKIKEIFIEQGQMVDGNQILLLFE